MTVFDVYVNDRKLCRAGVGKDGVLDAIVSWVKLTGPAAREARRARMPLEETRLHVGGLREDVHRRWAGRDLAVGDRVTVAILAGDTFDPPTHEKPQDPRQIERQQRRYYLRLKRRFEGPAKQSSSKRRRIADEAETTVLNVDLDVWSRSPLDRLVDAFGRSVDVLHVGKEGRRYGAHLELAGSGSSQNADELIRRFVTLIKKLPRSSRTLWNQAQIREFNIGVQAGTKPFSYEFRLDQKILAAVASVNARLGTTVYAAYLAPRRRTTRSRPEI